MTDEQFKQFMKALDQIAETLGYVVFILGIAAFLAGVWFISHL